MLARLAMGVCFDPQLADIMGEIFDIIGEYGGLDIRKGRGPRSRTGVCRGHVLGRRAAHRDLSTDLPGMRAELEDASVLVSNLEINRHAGNGGVSGPVRRSGRQDALPGRAQYLSRSHDRAGAEQQRRHDEDFGGPPRVGLDTTRGDLQDMAVLTGARAFHFDAGDSIRAAGPADLGKARRAWVDKDYFGVSGGSGDPRQVRQHLSHLRARCSARPPVRPGRNCGGESASCSAGRPRCGWAPPRRPKWRRVRRWQTARQSRSERR